MLFPMRINLKIIIKKDNIFERDFLLKNLFLSLSNVGLDSKISKYFFVRAEISLNLFFQINKNRTISPRDIGSESCNFQFFIKNIYTLKHDFAKLCSQLVADSRNKIGCKIFLSHPRLVGISNKCLFTSAACRRHHMLRMKTNSKCD